MEKKWFWFSLLSLTESFIGGRVERDIIINEHMSASKVTVIIVKYSLKLNFHYRFLPNSLVLIIKKSVQWELIGKQKGQINGRFSQNCEGS
jgi:hypothetical protein